MNKLNRATGDPMHLKRWLSGLVIAPSLTLFILYAPPWLFLLLLLFLTLLGLREFYSLSLPEISLQEQALGILLGLLVPLFFYPRDPYYLLPGLTIILFFRFVLTFLHPEEEFSTRINQLGKHLLGIFYVSFLFAHFLLLQGLEDGKKWILFALVVVYSGDIAAFYVGRTWGRRKMAPKLSPHKTMEGGIGAMAGSIGAALFFRFIFLPHIPILHTLVLGAGVGVLGQLGDLFESLIKRSAKVKDSGKLIPGHGGFLDRIDSALFASPFVYYFSWLTRIG